MGDDLDTTVEPCGVCGVIPDDWDWRTGLGTHGGHVVCQCGVSGPAVPNAGSFWDCLPAWNRMWAKRASVASEVKAAVVEALREAGLTREGVAK